MKNNYGLLGLGQCGSNQVYAMKQYQYPSFYINSAERDLQSLGSDIHYYHIPNAKGCHKDRLVSKEYLALNCDEVLSNISRYLDTRYIFLFSSLGGGTSSGMVALLAELIESELDKICILVCTIPNLKSEPMQAKINAYECLKELIEINKHTLFLIDNNKENVYSKSNTTFSKNLHNFLSEYGTSVDGIMDESEIQIMLETKGYGFINTFNRKSTHLDITQDIQKSIINGVHADIEKHNSLYLCGIKTTTMKKTTNIDFNSLNIEYGIFRDCYIGYQSNTELICMTGLKYPVSSINKIYESIQQDKQNIEKDLKAGNNNIVFKDDYSINIPTTKNNIKPKKNLSAREKMLSMLKK